MGSAQLKSNPMDILGLPSEHDQLLESPGPAQPGSLPHSPFFRDGGSLPYLLIKSETFRRLKKRAGRAWYQRRRVKVIAAVIVVLGCFFLVDWLMLLRLQDQEIEDINFGDIGVIGNYSMSSSMGVPSSIQAERKILGKNMEQGKGVYSRMLALAAHALAEGHNKPEPKDLWQEPFFLASAWKPCSNRSNWIMSSGSNGYIMITANGGINQQRVAVCNGVAVARLLNATLVIPKFLYSSVWRDSSQFSDIYQEQYFIDYLAPDIHIVKDLPEELRSLDLEAMGSVVTDADIPKESKPKFYLKHILPILIRNRVVHFLGFGNRLAFDPIPFHIQRLRCACNFHALRFIPKIQETAAFLLQRMRRNAHPGPLDSYLVGPYAETILKDKKTRTMKNSKFLSLHLRFEIDMVAHSLCNFGGGEEERRELEAYREIHFPALVQLKQATRLPSPEALRSEGLCPLTPEEAVLMLVALGFRRKTRIFIAGANIYGGSSRLATLNSLYPNLVTKENLLSATELEPFRNFSSQLAALDFIVCTASDAFAMTDSGSQLSSLVSGYRIYYGGGKMPTIRPNKRRLAAIYAKNTTIEWRVFEQRVRKAIRQTKHVQTRPVARSVYRYPRCKECMCNSDPFTN
ncbi:hypothetical protein SAY86_003526 [Trapa natans]|uniref:O-fucosyltransferase family protein n=1 Tax=Trapa natans TaxID=22666 RepID=A0AAN7ME43_TRANT|nr:hypothetical protein SAY86_003526 [Trapa natans]